MGPGYPGLALIDSYRMSSSHLPEVTYLSLPEFLAEKTKKQL